MQRDDEVRTFRSVPGLAPLITVFGVYCIWGVYRVAQDPSVLSAKGMAVLAILMVGGLIVWKTAIQLWSVNWRLTVTPAALVAVHVLTGKRVVMPWQGVIEVCKVPRWPRGTISLTQMRAADRSQVCIATQLMGYEEFMGIVKSRATNCRLFDRYVTRWDT